MHRHPACYVVTLFSLLVASALPLAAAGDPSAAPFRLPIEVRPLRYDLELVLDPAQHGFSGRVGIDVRLERASDLIWLHARELELDRATLVAGDGAPLAAEVVPGSEHMVGLRLAQAVGPGEARLEIAYRGIYQTRDSAGIFKQEDGGEPYLFTQFEPLDARRAVPSFDEPRFKTPWRLTLVVPADNQGFANTPLEASEPAAEGMMRLRFAESLPLPSYLVAFAVGPFESVDAGTVGDTPVGIIALAGKADRAAYAQQVTAELLDLHERWLEIPYPYEKLDSVAIPKTIGFGAMENVGLMTYAERLLLIPPAEQTPDRERRYASVAAHEIAHQWFGNLVTPEWWDDIWLNESFATWMAAEIVGRWRPDWEREASETARTSAAMAADAMATAVPVVQPIANEHDIETAFSPISYGKGSALLSMFESWMGEGCTIS